MAEITVLIRQAQEGEKEAREVLATKPLEQGEYFIFVNPQNAQTDYYYGDMTVYNANWEEIANFYNVTLSNLCSRFNINGLVVDIETQKLTAFGADEKQSRRQLWDNLLFLDRYTPQYMQETRNYKMMVVTDKISKTDYLNLWGNFDNGDIFLLRTPLESIHDSVGISNRFLAYVGIISAIISGIIIWFLTKRYTKPIVAYLCFAVPFI